MASSKEFLEYILEQLSEVEEITYRAMMGEYIIYYKGRIAGGIYDDRLLIKPVKSAIDYVSDIRYEVPYEGAKEMILIEEVDNKEYLTELFKAIYDDLPTPKKKKITNIENNSILWYNSYNEVREMKVKEICDYSGSTLLGMNGGMVESPDSKRIIYARKADLTKSETEIWICDRDFENHRKVYDVHCGNHNGPSATFITNSLIVFRDVEFEGIAGKEPSICVFRILDVDTGEVKYKIRGKESHCAENGKYPFSISTEYLDKNPDYPEINSCGIYILDVESGKITLVATEEDILNMVREHGLTPNEHTASVSHVQLNPSATAVMMRLGVKDCPVFGALGCIDLDTKKTHMIADKPVHQLWFDDDTYMATRQFNQGRHIEMETSYIARFSKDGEELEVLGGISNHMDGSFDRKYFAGDRCYPDFAPNVYLYKRGDKNPIATFEISQDEYTTWKLQVHPNPSFSHDGKRLYFNKQCKCYNGTYRTVAVFADVSEII